VSLISRKVLTEQLRELEEDGIVRREAFAELPPRVEYSLTAYGRALLPIIRQLSAWHCASPGLAASEGPTGAATNGGPGYPAKCNAANAPASEYGQAYCLFWYKILAFRVTMRNARGGLARIAG
jgi:DNA-binding MarR family transcriptional regulator